MRKHWTSLALAVALTSLVACGGGSGESAEPAADTADHATTEATTPAETHTETSDAVTASATIEGSLSCGHCNHQIGSSCSAAVQTADGKVYILEDMAGGSEPFDQRFDQKNIKVSGTVVERDGINYVKVSSFELL